MAQKGAFAIHRSNPSDPARGYRTQRKAIGSSARLSSAERHHDLQRFALLQNDTSTKEKTKHQMATTNTSLHRATVSLELPAKVADLIAYATGVVHGLVECNPDNEHPPPDGVGQEGRDGRRQPLRPSPLDMRSR
jgi:hypothetical protein